MTETQTPATVTLTIDGRQVTVPKGTNVIEAAKSIGIEVSAFCYHPGLAVVAVCRQCLVNVEGQPKLRLELLLADEFGERERPERGLGGPIGGFGRGLNWSG